MNNIEYRTLELEDFKSTLLEKFNRYQETRRVWFKEHQNKYNIKEDYFVEEWDDIKKVLVIKALQNCIISGGCVIGAFVDGHIKGFASIEGGLFGTRKEYVELSYIHISCECRGMGIGKKLFQLSCEKASELGAKKIYIGAHPSEESQGFYKSVGCTEAKEVNEEIYNREPLDIQMEFVL